MPDLVNRGELFGSKSLSRRENRSARKAMLSKLSHVGFTLDRLDREEREGVERAMDPGCNNGEFCALIRALDTIRERRRILLGIPLPSANGGKRRLIDMPQAQVRDAILIPAHQAVNGVDSSVSPQ